MTHRRYVLVCALLLLSACQRGMNTDSATTSSRGTGEGMSSVSSSGAVETFADNLRIPWDIAFLPEGGLLVTERPGTLVQIGNDGERIPVEGVEHIGEGGLLGIALSPTFADDGYVYLYSTSRTDRGIENRIERYVLEGNTLRDRTVLLGGIPGAVYHDGGALRFGPDGYLYATTGDAGHADSAQDTGSLAGKILRLTADGLPAPGNPLGTAVYSYGHRNPQGLAWDENGNLWSTEHGRSGVRSGYDELNLIVAGGNYGWPDIQGDESADGMIAPVMHSGPQETWAPASAAFQRGTVYFGGLRGEALYAATLNHDNGVLEFHAHLQGRYGRIRAVVAGPDGMLYITTSNTDGRGRVQPGDDRIVRIDPRSL